MLPFVKMTPIFPLSNCGLETVKTCFAVFWNNSRIRQIKQVWSCLKQIYVSYRRVISDVSRHLHPDFNIFLAWIKTDTLSNHYHWLLWESYIFHYRLISVMKQIVVVRQITFCHLNYRYRVQTLGMIKEGLTERCLLDFKPQWPKSK